MLPSHSLRHCNRHMSNRRLLQRRGENILARASKQKTKNRAYHCKHCTNRKQRHHWEYPHNRNKFECLHCYLMIDNVRNVLLIINDGKKSSRICLPNIALVVASSTKWSACTIQTRHTIAFTNIAHVKSVILYVDECFELIKKTTEKRKTKREKQRRATHLEEPFNTPLQSVQVESSPPHTLHAS
jgi:hypothetical protein